MLVQVLGADALVVALLGLELESHDVLDGAELAPELPAREATARGTL